MHFSSSQAIQSLPASAGVNTIYIIPNEGDPIYSVFHNVYDLVKWVYVVRGGNIGSLIPIHKLQHSPQSGAIQS
jgi:hypothetical protein